MSSVRIERADVDDVGPLASVFEEMRAENDRPASEHVSFDRALGEWMRGDGSAHLVWLASIDGTAIGMIWMAPVARVPRPHLADRWSADIQTFWVRPEHRGRGVGRRLLDAALAEADARGFERVTVHSSQGAVTLYERAEFRSERIMLNRNRP